MLSIPTLLLLPLLIQVAPQRVRVAGAVKGKDGKVWVGAKVVLHSEPLFAFAGFGTADTVETKTSKRGRFRAEILAGRRYRARAELVRDGKLITTRVVTIEDRRIKELVDAGTLSDVDLELIGIEGWPGAGFVVRDWAGREHAVDVTRTGTAKLAATFGPRATLLMRRGKARLWRRSIDFNAAVRIERRTSLGKQRAKLKDVKPLQGPADLVKRPLPAAPTERVMLPLPVTVPVRVEDATGKPLAGASVGIVPAADAYRQTEWYERATTTTDAAGKAEVRAPWPLTTWGSPQSTLQLVVASPQMALASVGYSTSSNRQLTRIDKAKLAARRLPELVVKMKPGWRIHGKVTGTEAVPAAGLPVLVDVPGARERAGSWTQFYVLGLTRVKTDGTWEVTGVGKRSYGLRAALLLSAANAARLGFPPLVRRISLGGYQGVLTTDVKRPTLDLGKLRGITVKGTLSDGRPARYATVTSKQGTVNSSSWYQPSPLFDQEQRLDRRGEAHIVIHDEKAHLLIQADSEYLLQPIKLDPKAKELAVTLKPYAYVRGRCVDQDGKAFPGVDIRIRSTTWSNGNPLTSIASSLNQRLIKGKSDAEGRFEIRFIPNAGLSYGLGTSIRVGGRSVYSQVLLNIANESIEDAEMVVPAKLPAKNAKKQKE